MNVIDILNEMNESNSRTHKESVLLKHKGNETLKNVFRLTYSPMIRFHIRKVPNVQRTGESPTIDLDEALEFIETTLATRQLTGNRAIEALGAMLNCMSSDDAEVLSRVIKRDLEVGATSNTANKIWKNLVPKYPCMLAAKDEPKVRAGINFPALAQIKADGARTHAHFDGTEVTFFSRNGREMTIDSEELKAAVKDIFKNAGYENGVLDGEMLLATGNGVVDRKTGNGIVNKAIKGTIKPEEVARIRLVVWDITTLEKFFKGKDTLKYGKRFEALEEAIANTSQGLISAIYSTTIHDWDEAEEFYSQAYASGEEGLIIKNFDSIWENKRSKHSMKMKAELECDLLVVGVTPHRKDENKVGSLQCVSGGSNHIVVSVGSGLNDYDREMPFDYYIGKIVTVKYNEVIESKGNAPRSLFLPIFVCVRGDKNEPEVM